MTAYQGPNDSEDTNLSDWLVAARIDFGGGFRIAAAHKQVTNDNEATQSQLTDVGVRFVSGANSFSLVGSSGQMDNNDAEHTGDHGKLCPRSRRGRESALQRHLERDDERRRSDDKLRHRPRFRHQGGVLARLTDLGRAAWFALPCPPWPAETVTFPFDRIGDDV